MTANLPNIQRMLFAALGALLVSTTMLSAAVVPSIAPMTAQPAL